MFSNETATVEELERVLISIHYHGYVSIAALTLVTWDYILTVRDEYNLIWKQRKNWVTVLFAINRYLIFAELLIGTYGYLSTNVPYTFCTIAVAYGLVAAGGIHLIVSDSIVWLCVSALYGHVKKVRYPLLALQISAFIGAVFALVFVDNNSVNYEPNLPDDVKMCTRSVRLDGVWAFWLPILGYELINLGLVTYKYHRYRKDRMNFRSDLLELILRNTMMYLALICAIFGLNSWMYANPDQIMTTALNSITLAICSVLGSRMLLNLREEDQRRKYADSYTMSTIAGLTIPGSVHFAWRGDIDTTDSAMSQKFSDMKPSA